MRNFKKVNLDGKGGDITANRGLHSGDYAEPSKYSRPESRFASEDPEASEWAWKGDDPRAKPTSGTKPVPAKAWKGSEKLTKPITGVKPVPANRWKGSEQLTKPVTGREAESSDFTWKFSPWQSKIRRMVWPK